MVQFRNCFFSLPDCGTDSDITLADDGSIVNLTSPNYPANYPINPNTGITCQWFVQTASGARVYAHFVDFSIAFSDNLYFGRDLNNIYEVGFTGYDLPLDVASPVGSTMLVITFKVFYYSSSERGFHLELSNAEEIGMC